MRVSRVRWLGTSSVEENRVLAYAARQLARYGEKLIGEEAEVRRARKMGEDTDTAWLGICDRMPEAPGASLTPAPWDDGFAVWGGKGKLHISGRNARSVLYGVYAFLEHQGVRFVRPSQGGELIPTLEEFSIPEEPLIEKPGYRHRGVCIEGAPSIQHALAMVDWCAKKRMNTVFLQFFSSRYFFNRWYEHAYSPAHAGKPITEEQALALDDKLIEAMKRRGMVFHRVGHSWTSATFDMPRSGWVTAEDEEIKPEHRRFLAEVNGERKLFGDIPINTEICYGHQPAFDRFVDNIVAYSQEHPEMDVVHVWLSDAPNNKCEDEDCRPLNISDWYAKVINALSKALAEKAPHTRFVFLCYFELWWPPEQVEIDDSHGNAIMMFAPIRRCYGHSLGDPECDDGQEWPRPALNQFESPQSNSFYVKSLTEWRKVFQGDSFDYDYHLMWAVWQQLTDTVVARVIHEDLQQLKGLGLDGIVSCQSFRNFYPSGLAMTALTDSLWNPDEPWEELRRRYLQSAYGPHLEVADQYLTQIEEYLATEDPHWRRLPFSDADGPALATIEGYLKEAVARFDGLKQEEPNQVYKRSLELLAHHARLLEYIVRAYQARMAGKPALADRELDRAAGFLQRTESRLSLVMDTELALKLSVEAHRVEA